jgi:hypothetical protein
MCTAEVFYEHIIRPLRENQVFQVIRHAFFSGVLFNILLLLLLVPGAELPS